ncbi:MAG: type II toxin-antitoxin system VapC family toxin [Candidatus Saccharibacteria bacterium]|nr:type II toxin-antitoxin system VapC family toxin [Candidatus Saccharibacteria bacterium]
MALKYVLDTSAYSTFNLNQHNLGRFINPNNEIFIPLIVIAELRAGFKTGSREQFNELLLSNLLDAPNITILQPSEKTTKSYAQIYSQLHRIGKPISTNDIWIAALCLEHELPILTLDTDFRHIKNLVCIDVLKS